jgi:hypothetical protein
MTDEELTDEELVKALRDTYDLVKMWPEKRPDGFTNLLVLRNLVPDTANRIEALTEQLKAARADAKENDALKAKLAKAVNCLWMAKEYIRDLESHEGAEGFSVSTEILGKAYYATLAEIEGEK